MDAESANNVQLLESSKCEVCQKPALYKCRGCHTIYYCSKQHQLDHWKHHKLTCRPFKLHKNEVSVFTISASRDIGAGEKIIQEKPIIWGPFLNTIDVCLGCNDTLNKENSKPCSQCGWPVCGDLCEKSPQHIPECRYTSHRGEKVDSTSPQIMYKCVIILRCLYYKKFIPKSWKKIKNFPVECESLNNYDNEAITFAKFIRRFFKLYSVFSEEEILQIYKYVMKFGEHLKIKKNSFVALYGLSSLVEHSCNANCSKNFSSNGDIIITSAKPIRKGEHLKICYTDPLWGTIYRRRILHERKYFWCSCDRCEDPTEFGTNLSALKCQKNNCDGCLLPTSFINVDKLLEWFCQKCNHGISCYLAHDILEKIDQDFTQVDKTDIEDCQNFLEACRCYLYENHFYCLKIKYVLSQLLGKNGLEKLSIEEVETKLKYCQNLESIVKIIAPTEKEILGRLIFEKCMAINEITKRTSSSSENKSVLKEILQENMELLESIQDNEYLKKMRDFMM